MPLGWMREIAGAACRCRAISIRCCSSPAAKRSTVRVGAILEALGQRPFIFNLGHGILPETPIEHVERLVEPGEEGVRLAQTPWQSMLLAYIKAFHVIAIIAWMAGLLYLPRLFVYHATRKPGSEQSETFKVMERRLLALHHHAGDDA